MQVRQFLDADHPTVCSWWSVKGHAIVSPSALPGTGAICESADGTPLAAAFLYLSNAQLAYLGWVVANPERKRKEIHRAVEMTIMHLVTLAKSLDIQTLIATSGSRGLSRILKRNGLAPLGPHELLYKEL